MTDETPAALWDHAFSVYAAMKENAQTEVLRVGMDDEGLVYEGFLTRLVTGELGLSVPYYSKVTRVLKDMGCIQQLRRGGATTPSRWLLLADPDYEVFQRVVDRPSASPQKPNDQRINDLNHRINDLEDKVEAMWETWLETHHQG